VTVKRGATVGQHGDECGEEESDRSGASDGLDVKDRDYAIESEFCALICELAELCASHGYLLVSLPSSRIRDFRGEHRGRDDGGLGSKEGAVCISV